MKATVERESPSKAAAAPDKEGFKKQQPGVTSLFPPSFNLTVTPPPPVPPNTPAQMGEPAFPIPPLQLTNGAKPIPQTVPRVSNPQGPVPGVVKTSAQTPLLDNGKVTAAIEYLKDREAGRKFEGANGRRPYVSNYGYLQAEEAFFESLNIPDPLILPYKERVLKIAEFQKSKDRPLNGKLDEPTLKLARINYIWYFGLMSRTGKSNKKDPRAFAFILGGTKQNDMAFRQAGMPWVYTNGANFLIVNPGSKDGRDLLKKKLKGITEENKNEKMKLAGNLDGQVADYKINKIAFFTHGLTHSGKKPNYFYYPTIQIGIPVTPSVLINDIQAYLDEKDLKVFFFSCHTGDLAETGKGFAFESTALLAESGKKRVDVWGHKEPGDTVMNPLKFKLSFRGAENLIYLVNNRDAYIRDPDDLDKFKLKDNQRIPPIPLGTSVIVDKETENKEFAHVIDAHTLSKELGWIAKSNLSLQVNVSSRKQAFLDSINGVVIKQIVKAGGYKINTEAGRLPNLVREVKNIFEQKERDYFIVLKKNGKVNNAYSPMGYMFSTNPEAVVKTVLAQLFEEKRTDFETRFPAQLIGNPSPATKTNMASKNSPTIKPPLPRR